MMVIVGKHGNDLAPGLGYATIRAPDEAKETRQKLHRCSEASTYQKTNCSQRNKP